MTKEITKAFILQQIQDKFKLREFEHAPFLFDETVVPVYNIEQHFQKPLCSYSQKSITSVGGMVFYTVPQNEKWELFRYVVVFLTGAFEVSGVYIVRSPNLANFAYLDLTAGQTISYANDLPKSAILNPGDQLGINIDSYTTTGNLRLYIDANVETLR